MHVEAFNTSPWPCQLSESSSPNQPLRIVYRTITWANAVDQDIIVLATNIVFARRRFDLMRF